MKPRADVQIQEISIFVHGVLFSFHILGVLYNLRHRNKLDVVAHGLAAAYDLRAVHTHLHHLRDLTLDVG